MLIVAAPFYRRIAVDMIAGARAVLESAGAPHEVIEVPGALEAMEREACADWRGTTLIEGAGHWAQQEAPEETAAALLRFLAGL